METLVTWEEFCHLFEYKKRSDNLRRDLKYWSILPSDALRRGWKGDPRTASGQAWMRDQHRTPLSLTMRNKRAGTCYSPVLYRRSTGRVLLAVSPATLSSSPSVRTCTETLETAVAAARHALAYPIPFRQTSSLSTNSDNRA